LFNIVIAVRIHDVILSGGQTSMTESLVPILRGGNAIAGGAPAPQPYIYEKILLLVITPTAGG
jgi:hypothetical protein